MREPAPVPTHRLQELPAVIVLVPVDRLGELESAPVLVNLVHWLEGFPPVPALALVLQQHPEVVVAQPFAVQNPGEGDLPLG